MAAPSTVSLSDYLGSLRRLLHDASDVIWSAADKTSYINEAIQQRDLDSGGQRKVGTLTLTVDQGTYTFAELSAATGFAASGNIFDIINITLLQSGFRRVLDVYSYSEMNSTPGQRAYTSLSGLPSAWCRYGDQSIIIGPAPASAYQVEIDALLYATPAYLVDTDDTDFLQFPYTYPVPLYAAYLCKQNERMYDEAEFFKARYDEAIAKINAARTGTTPSLYGRA